MDGNIDRLSCKVHIRERALIVSDFSWSGRLSTLCLSTIPSMSKPSISRQFAMIIRGPEESRLQLSPYAPGSRVVTFATDSLFPSSLQKAVLGTPLNAKPSDLTVFSSSGWSPHSCESR